MIYLKAKNGALFCYDEGTTVTLTLKNGRWEVSELTYSALMTEEGVSVISEKDASGLFGGNSPEQAILELQAILN